MTVAPTVFAPELLISSRVGGTGDQHVVAVGIGGDGSITIDGGSFAVRYESVDSLGNISGDVDGESGPRRIVAGQPSVDGPARGRRSMPGRCVSRRLVCSEGWSLWGWSLDQLQGDADAGHVTADSRVLGLWRGGGVIVGVIGHAATANTSFARDPQDLSKACAALEAGAIPSSNGPASFIAKIVADLGRYIQRPSCRVRLRSDRR